MSGTVPVGIKRKTSRAEDSREKLTSQKRSKTVSGGKKGVDFITIKHKDDKEDFRVGDCILVQSEKKNMPYVSASYLNFVTQCGVLHPISVSFDSYYAVIALFSPAIGVNCSSIHPYIPCNIIVITSAAQTPREAKIVRI